MHCAQENLRLAAGNGCGTTSKCLITTSGRSHTYSLQFTWFRVCGCVSRTLGNTLNIHAAHMHIEPFMCCICSCGTCREISDVLPRRFAVPSSSTVLLLSLLAKFAPAVRTIALCYNNIILLICMWIRSTYVHNMYTMRTSGACCLLVKMAKRGSWTGVRCFVLQKYYAVLPLSCGNNSTFNRFVLRSEVKRTLCILCVPQCRALEYCIHTYLFERILYDPEYYKIPGVNSVFKADKKRKSA